jgi:pimeloyl-ACP methyl ester carboxylesterase
LPASFGPIATDPVTEYARDFWQRSVIFLDILRQRGNQQAEITARPINSVLIFDYQIVLRGEDLPRPVNYALVRVIPPEGTKIDERKRPVVVIDPRAGQGPGIGGFKPVSEIGDAFKAGHPVYFIGFAAEPVRGQTVEDVARAHTVFTQKVIELHPEAEGKPFIIGNCQAGWHAMMAACMRPDLVGPVMIAGAPLSYWGGVRGKNPMRYNGGILGGSWLAQLTSDLGDGKFDGAWLVANFDNLNPANTFWTKQYSVWADPEKEQDRYLEFEKWWGDFITLRGEELRYMVDNLFIGNRFSSGQIVTGDGTRLDLRDVKSPIVCFCSQKDNITPPQQALDWIVDNYRGVDEIRKSGQTILYCVHETAGHLAIFVGTKVAAKEHAEFINVLDLIDCMPPGLYEILITEKAKDDVGADLIAGDYNVRIEARSIDDIRALGGNSTEEDREFATVARMSEVNQSFYRTYVEPWVKGIVHPQFAQATLAMNPLRLSYALFSDKNPMMRGVAAWAEQARAERAPSSSGNACLAMQKQFAEAVVKLLDMYRDFRDQMVEQTFHMVYGSPAVQAFYGTSASDADPRPRPGRSPWTQLELEAEIARLKSHLAEGGPLEAAARAIIYITEAQRFVDARSFEVLRRLLEAHPEVTLEHVKAVLREQCALLAIDERGAMAALKELMPADAAERRDLMDKVKLIVTAAGKLSDDAQRRLQEVEGCAEATPRKSPATNRRQPVAAMTAGGIPARAQARSESQ